MSQNFNKEEKESVERITRSILPVYALTSAFVQSNKSRFCLQSEEITEGPPPTDSVSSPDDITSQNVSFVDNAEGEIILAGSPVNVVAKVDNTEDLQLGSFLSRPTQIDNFTWTTSDVVSVKKTIKPWQLFLNNTNIKKKIDNFAFIRGKLHVKVVINGTPFQYGMIRACYSPLLGLVSDKVRTNATSNNPLLIPYSQMPGFFISPAANAGGQIELPFFYPKNWLNLTSSSDVGDMGSLVFVVYAPLGVAVTGGSTSVTVQTFAWMSEVELMASTSKLALQGDEYTEGPISGPATAIANVASYLTKTPVIAPFARATVIGANAVGSIARLFGYTNAPTIDSVHTFQPQTAPMLASAHIGTPVQKLTLDPKQELSIDPTLHGLHNVDELSINYIKKKESYLSGGTWSTSDAVDTQLWNARVTPCLCAYMSIDNSSSVEVGRRVYHTPLDYLSRMFTNWRGTIIFRIKIVSTKFHKGRLKISYDPVNDITSTNPDINTVYTQIVDIGEQDDIEIEVPYHQAQAWLYTDRGTVSENNSPANTLAPRNNVDNGVITLRVLNTLTAPASGSIQFMVFVRAGDDFEFANPSSHIGYEDSYKIPSFFALQAEDLTSILPTRHVLGQKTKPCADRFAQNYGESILSLRNLLHRYVTQDNVVLDSQPASSINVIGKTFRIMPYTPGFDTNANTFNSASKVVAASGTAAYCFVPMHTMPYVAGMYLGYRGGANINITPGYDIYGNTLTDFRVSRTTRSHNDAQQRIWKQYKTILRSATQSSRSWNLNDAYVDDSLGGIAINSSATNGSLTFQLPDFKNTNFSLADPTKYINGQGADGTDRSNALLRFNIVTGASSSTDITLQTQVSAAPDFTCLFWLCCPTLDYLKNNPTPV